MSTQLQLLELLFSIQNTHIRPPLMGVPGLWKELQSHGHDTALARLSELRSSSPSSSSSSSSSSQHSLRLGIDISSWLFHAQKSIGGYNPQLRLLFYRLCRLLAVPDALPVFVFDGPQRPKEKRGKVVQKYRENSFVNDLKDLITAFGFVVHDALGEAEAEMARLVQMGVLDAVMSDDVDCFVFGANLVIRNWGQELSGSKARTDYVAEQSASDHPSASDADEHAQIATVAKSALSAKDRLALGTNLVTYFRASSLEQDDITQAGLILVAILSGGDYDVQGLPRCGAKISMALARAGYGDSLIDGLKKHCSSPKHHSASTRLASPEASKSWPAFLAEWRDSVRQELSTNKSGHLGRRFKKLAESPAFAELLSTKASLSVLGSYVWPLTSNCTPNLSSTTINIGRIGQLCQHLFHWTAPHTLETLRNNLWQGCAIRELSGDAIYKLKRTAVKAKPIGRKISRTDSGKISTFFSVKAKSTDGQTPSDEVQSVVLTIAGERENGSTGYVKEARAVCDVKAYVDLAKEGLDFELSSRDLEGDEALPSSQSTTASPRKRKPLTDPKKELRMWIAIDVIKRTTVAAKELQQYHRKKSSSKVVTLENKQRSTIDQGRLDSFFVGGKANVKPALVPSTKRRAPLQTSSQSSLSSAPSRSPSPTFKSPTKAKRYDIPIVSIPIIPRQGSQIPDWDSDILNSSEDEGINERYNSNDDSTLPAMIIPTIAKQDNTQQNIPGDDSVEFISANVVTHNTTKRATAADMPIEVSDDSDED